MCIVCINEKWMLWGDWHTQAVIQCQLQDLLFRGNGCIQSSVETGWLKCIKEHTHGLINHLPIGGCLVIVDGLFKAIAWRFPEAQMERMFSHNSKCYPYHEYLIARERWPTHQCRIGWFVASVEKPPPMRRIRQNPGIEDDWVIPRYGERIGVFWPSRLIHRYMA